MKFNQPKCCAQCFYINPYNNFMICTNPSFPKEMKMLDVSSFRVNPDTIPDWCPYTLTNKAIALMPKEKQCALEKIIDGLSSLLGIDVMRLPESPQKVSGNERKD